MERWQKRFIIQLVMTIMIIIIAATISTESNKTSINYRMIMDQTDNKNTVESRNIWITSDQDQVIFGFNIKTSLITKFKVLEPMLTERGLFRIMEPVTTGYYICEGKKKHTIFMSNDECKTVQWHDIVNGIILDHEWFSLMSHENVIQFNINLFDEAKIKTIGPYYVEDVNRFFCRTNESDIAQTSIPMLAYKLILVVMIMIILVIIVYFCWAINPVVVAICYIGTMRKLNECYMIEMNYQQIKRYQLNDIPVGSMVQSQPFWISMVCQCWIIILDETV
ncbi:hypothetical protein RDWZM_007641 [Blomia tropicalis]|uniref:Uncharacterized protein n=1 Tax=Blomia tropicalis TaxID=40697 RepID=A0A9Q0M055_BLOTA|nr:hypothetical protein RDWZM_007641 [Blomia tropicalis]